ncbi:hypothetical protein ACLMJK_005661 [Lecanora helva]
MPDFTFAYHMTDSHIGFDFTNYEYSYSRLRNDFIQQTLKEAAQKITKQLDKVPLLSNQAVKADWIYLQAPHEITLKFVPNVPKMTYGDIRPIIALLSLWATQYKGSEVDFDIWAYPGTSNNRKLGTGYVLDATRQPKMPGPRWTTFPYHMTPSNPLGLIFNHYDYLSTFDNDIISLTFEEASLQINKTLSLSPALEHQPVPNGWHYSHQLPPEYEDSYSLGLGGPTMTYGNVRDVVALLLLWANEWRTVETSFDIWAWPGTAQGRMLGSGSLLFVF